MPPQQSIVRQGPRSAQRQRSVLAELFLWSAAILVALCTIYALDSEAVPGFQDMAGPPQDLSERAQPIRLSATQVPMGIRRLGGASI